MFGVIPAQRFGPDDDCICGHLRREHLHGSGACHGIDHGHVECCSAFRSVTDVMAEATT